MIPRPRGMGVHPTSLATLVVVVDTPLLKVVTPEDMRLPKVVTREDMLLLQVATRGDTSLLQVANLMMDMRLLPPVDTHRTHPVSRNFHNDDGPPTRHHIDQHANHYLLSQAMLRVVATTRSRPAIGPTTFLRTVPHPHPSTATTSRTGTRCNSPPTLPSTPAMEAVSPTMPVPALPASRPSLAALEALPVDFSVSHSHLLDVNNHTC